MFRPRKLLTILIVEEEVPVLRSIELEVFKLFRPMVQIIKATTFKKAEEIIDNGIIDIAIIDLLLPDGHGENLIARIRSKLAYVPIIVQTSEEDI